jgi:hypothetical protein
MCCCGHTCWREMRGEQRNRQADGCDGVHTPISTHTSIHVHVCAARVAHLLPPPLVLTELIVAQSAYRRSLFPSVAPGVSPWAQQLLVPHVEVGIVRLRRVDDGDHAQRVHGAPERAGVAVLLVDGRQRLVVNLGLKVDLVGDRVALVAPCVARRTTTQAQMTRVGSKPERGGCGRSRKVRTSGQAQTKMRKGARWRYSASVQGGTHSATARYSSGGCLH